MDPAIGAGIIGAGAKLIGGLFGMKSNSDNNKLQMELAKYNWDKQMEFWNMQNEYNTPKKQMERFAEAGLNPNLIYGQGTNGNSSFSPTPQMPKTSPYRLDMSYADEISQLLLQKRALDSDVALKEKQAKTEEAKVQSMAYDNAVKDADAALRRWELAYKENAREDMLKALAEDAKSKQEYARSLRLSNDFTEKANPLRLTNIELQNKEAEQQIQNAVKQGRKIDSETALNYAKVQTERTQQRLNLSSAQLNDIRVVAQHLANKGQLIENSLNQQTYNTRVSLIEASLNKALVDIENGVKEGRIKDAEAAKKELYQGLRDNLGLDLETDSYAMKEINAVWFGVSGFINGLIKQVTK